MGVPDEAKNLHQHTKKNWWASRSGISSFSIEMKWSIRSYTRQQTPSLLPLPMRAWSWLHMNIIAIQMNLSRICATWTCSKKYFRLNAICSAKMLSARQQVFCREHNSRLIASKDSNEITNFASSLTWVCLKDVWRAGSISRDYSLANKVEFASRRHLHHHAFELYHSIFSLFQRRSWALS